ncbi:MAG TPA: ROK family protein [Buttiauxella sp.]|jgi:fructokinase
MYYLGLDIGGTKIAAVVIDTSGKEIARYRTETIKETYAAFIAGVEGFITSIKDEFNASFAIGIALPGSISPINGKIKNSNILVLNGKDLQSDLENQLGTPVVIENDANCFALSEAYDGAGQGHDVVFGVTLGTGCGGGITIHQKPFSGAWGNAGECGHITLPGYNPERDGPAVKCYCGKYNCTESFVSGTGLAERYFQLCGETLSTPEILRQAKMGKTEALEQVACFRHQLARVLATVVNVIDPHIIVIGGGLSNEPMLLDGIAQAIAPMVFTDVFLTPVVKAVHGDSSGMRGAAWLAFQSSLE